MEKRALIAFVLSLVVLLFWEYFFGLLRSPETRRQPESGMVAPGPAETQAQDGSPRIFPPPSLPTPFLRNVPCASISILTNGPWMRPFIDRKFWLPERG